MYACGFLKNTWKIHIMGKKKPFSMYLKLFCTALCLMMPHADVQRDKEQKVIRPDIFFWTDCLSVSVDFNWPSRNLPCQGVKANWP